MKYFWKIESYGRPSCQVSMHRFRVHFTEKAGVDLQIWNSEITMSRRIQSRRTDQLLEHWILDFVLRENIHPTEEAFLKTFGLLSLRMNKWLLRRIKGIFEILESSAIRWCQDVTPTWPLFFLRRIHSLWSSVLRSNLLCSTLSACSRAVRVSHYHVLFIWVFHRTRRRLSVVVWVVVVESWSTSRFVRRQRAGRWWWLRLTTTPGECTPSPSPTWWWARTGNPSPGQTRRSSPPPRPSRPGSHHRSLPPTLTPRRYLLKGTCLVWYTKLGQIWLPPSFSWGYSHSEPSNHPKSVYLTKNYPPK